MLDNSYKKMPFITAISAALIWALFYFIFDRLHGMQAMFDQQFPFLAARLLGLHNEPMSLLSGVFFAAVDAGVGGGAAGWLLRRLMLGKKKGQQASSDE